MMTLFFISSCTGVRLADAQKYQNELWEEYNNPETTPVKEDEREGFNGITFFPVNKKYILNTDFVFITDGKTLPLPTSAGKIKHYKEYGKAHFRLDGKDFELMMYQSDPPIEGYENYLFLPFTDDTNGITSYGGGRYLDFETDDIKDGKLLIDFNKTYNPLCAYSKYYNCPIPPANNYLETEIRAGVSYLE